MKKIVGLLCLFFVAFIAVAFFAPEKLPDTLRAKVYEAKQSLGLNTNVVTHEKALYKNTKKDGSVEFSDIQEGKSKKHQHSDKGSFIAMESAVSKDNAYDIPEGSSGLGAVADPINSMNSEAAKNVQKMREAKAKKMAEQGL